MKIVIQQDSRYPDFSIRTPRPGDLCSANDVTVEVSADDYAHFQAGLAQFNEIQKQLARLAGHES